MTEIIVTKKNIELKFDKSQFINCDQTYDGIVFNLKEGLNYYLIDTSMQVITKEKIKQALNSFDNAKVIKIDLMNYNSPAMIEF